MVRWLLSNAKCSIWNFDFLGSGPGGRRFKSSLPDHLVENELVARYEYWGEPLAEYPGDQIRAPFVLIFLNTYGLSSDAIRL
jgi:hypothetical protein